MFVILRHKAIVAVILCCLTRLAAGQQLNMPNYDHKKKVHFGFTLGFSSNNFKIRTSQNFLNIDSLKNVSVKRFPGFYLGGLVNFRLVSKVDKASLDLRILPSIAFAQRNLTYTFTDSTMNKEVKIESVYLEFPILLKYKTKRHRNTRFYTVAGIKYAYDLASNINATRSLADPVVALYPSTWSYEVGLGLDIYFPFFKFSPELKITNSFKSVLVKDGYVYTEAFDGFWSRIINFSLHFE